MRPILFIDRDGVLIQEPPENFQIDTLEKLEFVPGVFGALSRIRKETDFLLVMVSNQDGLGTASYPYEDFALPQEKMLKTLEGEGIIFDAIHIDESRPEDNLPTRKPGTGMLPEYLAGAYDLERSLVIGDRLTDLEMAKNIGCKAIWFSGSENRELLEAGVGGVEAVDSNLVQNCTLVSNSWDEISRYITGTTYPLPDRTAKISRKTKETETEVSINLDGTGKAEISTGLRFFDHMLDQVAKHSYCDVRIQVKGDLDVDEHHTIEDTAISLGQAFLQALGDKLGISRYGFMLPMDDSLAQAAIDFSGRPWLVWDVAFTRDRVGDVPTEMISHFFKSFSDEAKCNLNLSAKGENTHHIAEAVFKAFARAVRGAVKRDIYNMVLPSTKGVL
ncbi:MAG: bifunctional histidinol-phosphatase/imidazoleglycerol-phosphate dehydratase HisB [Bacteroidetes bacterium]|nr:bifunctional histidinol-phosphatase/imidazoleglycerol-phosphate dehydratase HisB [Bacteroidota bacterium]